MTVDTKKLREFAEAATPGPWKASGWHHEKFDGNHEVKSLTGNEWVCETNVSRLYEENAAFIAAADPQTVIGLLDKLAAMTAARDEACDHWEEYAEDVHRRHEFEEWPASEMQQIAELRKVGAE